jgi:hypothetical protein
LGAIHFSVDIELIRALRKHLPLTVFVETGTFKGDTTASVAALFPKVITVELAAELYEGARERLAAFPNVQTIQGSSPEAIRSLMGELASVGVLYWLDAHWCGGPTAGAQSECPLLGELEAIGSLNEDSAILIDDARFFTAPPPAPHDPGAWPSLLELVDRLRALSRLHRLWIIDDVMIFCPSRAAPDIVEYGRVRGTDLHRLYTLAANAAREIRKRDSQIAQLKARLPA